MTGKPRALELFCRQGGSAMGLYRAGFDVHGVDIEPQPRFPFSFAQADAIEYVRDHGHQFNLISGGPPCQRYSLTQRIQGNEHPDLIGAFREAAQASGQPYLIENVEEARPLLIDPVMMCGYSFGMRTDRHRLFESSVPLFELAHRKHEQQKVKMGRALQPGDRYHAIGNFSGVPYVRADMDVGWMSREGIRECVPPAFTEFIGRQIIEQLRKAA